MPDAQHVAPTLELISPFLPGRLYEMTRDVVRIGRDPGSDICLDRKDVSWSHARIFRTEDGFFVEDRESRNSTYLDGKKLRPRHPKRLDDNHRIKICGNILIFRREAVRVEQDENGSTILGMIGNLTSLEVVSRVARPEDVLRAVLEINRNLGGTIELNEALGRTLETLFAIFDEAEGGFILTREPEGNLVPRAIRHRGGAAPLTLSRNAQDLAIRQGHGLICGDDGPEGTGRTILCVPLLGRDGQSIGIIQLTSRPRGVGFVADDLDLLAAVAVPVGVAVENTRLLRAKAEWDAAGEVQRALLPRRRPVSERYASWEYYEPAQEVGGDYYDYIPIEPADDDGQASWVRWGVTLGDVVGKGMPAALVMSHLSAEVKHRVRAEPALDRVVEGLNRYIFDAEILDRFVTFLLIRVDADEDRITVVNAGHPTPIIRRASGKIEAIGEEESGPPLGVIPQHAYRPVTVRLGAGDVVIAYTDGVSEAINAHNRLFGVEAIRRTLLTAAPGAPAVGNAILSAVREHSLGRPQSDDIAIICFGRTS